MNKTQEALNGLKYLEHVSAQLKTYSDQGQHKHIPSHLSAGHCYEIAKEMDSVIKACKKAIEQPSHFGAEYMEGFNAGKMFAELEQPAQDFFERGKEIAKWADKQNEQPAQEPVALGDFDNMTKAECVDYIEYLRKEIDLLRFKEWQGLSEDDMAKLCDKYWDSENGHSIKDIITMVEQELKTKNGFSDVKEKNGH